MGKAWIRRLSITLTSKLCKKKMTFGEEHLKGKNDLYITVNGKKYMSILKDECVVRISNLSYSEIIQIIEGKYYDIQIQCGYKSQDTLNTIFDGGVLFISNERTNLTSNTVILLCASKLVASYGQQRINLTFQSGVNLYSAITYMNKIARLPNASVSKRLKAKAFLDSTSVNGTLSNSYEKLLGDDSIVNTDNSLQSVLSIYDSSKPTRIISLSNNNITFINGYPKLTNEGVTFTILPTMNFMCGDIVKIDNSIIDVSANNQDEAMKNYGRLLDANGLYRIYQISFSLSNRGEEFYLRLLCRSNEQLKAILNS